MRCVCGVKGSCQLGGDLDGAVFALRFMSELNKAMDKMSALQGGEEFVVKARNEHESYVFVFLPPSSNLK